MARALDELIRGNKPRALDKLLPDQGVSALREQMVQERGYVSQVAKPPVFGPVSQPTTTTPLQFLGRPKTPTTVPTTQQAMDPRGLQQAMKTSVAESGRTFGTDIKEAVPFVGKQLVAGASDVAGGILNLPRLLHTGVREAGAGIESAVTGKDVQFKGDVITDILGKGVEQQEQVGQYYGKADTPVGRVIGGAIRSIPQIAPVLAGATPATGLGFIGGQALGGGARDIEQRGGSTLQQIVGGGAKAGLEIATEVGPIGRLADIVGGKAGLKQVGKQMIEEFFGEGISTALNPLIDRAVFDPDAEFATAGEILESGITGSLAALITGGSAAKINSALQAAKNPTPENIDTLVNDVEIATGQAIPPEAVEQMKAEAQTINQFKTQEQLTQALQQRGLDATGTKAEQRARLKDAMAKPRKLDALIEKQAPTTMAAQIDQPSMARPASLVQQEGVRKTFESIQASPMVSEAIKKSMDPQQFVYEGITNEETMAQARDNLGTAQDFLQKPVGEDFTALDTARGIELMRQASNQGDFDTFNRLALKQAEQLTEAGQAVQAASMLRRMTPDGYLQYLNREVSKLNETGKQKQAQEDISELQKAIDNATPEQLTKIENILKKRNIKYSELTPENIQEYIDQIKDKSGIVELTADESKFIYDKIAESLTLEGRAKDIAIAEAYKVFEDKIPAKNKDKVAALQRISMLLNVKTQSRNVLGNLLMQTAEIGKEALAIPIDVALSKVTGERTLTPYRGTDITRGLQGVKKGLYEAWDDYYRGINTRRDSGQFETRSGKIFPTDTKFGPLNAVNKGLNKANDLTSFLLSAGDRPFFEATYNMEKSRLERLPQYQGKPDLVEQQALQTAEERTFQNQSALAKSAVEIREKAGLFGRLVLPYAYTPANITDKVFDYSPLGSIRTIGKNVVTDIKRGEFNQREFAERASRNLTGSALMYLGYMLAKAGIITGAYSEDKDEREFQKSIGIQDYAFTDGKTQFNFDWAQPIAVPFATGANLYQTGLTETNAKENIFNKLAQVSIESSKTLLEQPLLQGVQELFGGYGSEGILQNVANIVRTAPLQVVPGLSLARQARQTIDPTIRNIDYNSLLQSLRNQLPFTSSSLPPKFSTLGEEQQYSGGMAQKFLSPATITQLDPTPLENEIIEVFQTTGDRDVFPKAAPKSFSKDKVRYELTKEEQSQFQEVMGQYVKDQLEKLMNTPNYNKLTPEQKAKLFSAVISDGYDIAKADYFDGR